MAVDGTLIFDTKIDTDGVEKGSESLKSILNRLINSIEGLAKSVDSAINSIGFEKVNSGLQQVEQAAGQAEMSAEELERAMDAITITRFDDPASSLNQLDNALDTAATQANETNGALDQLNSTLNDIATQATETSQATDNIVPDSTVTNINQANQSASDFRNTLNLIIQTVKDIPGLFGKAGDSIKNAFNGATASANNLKRAANTSSGGNQYIKDLVDEIDGYKDKLYQLETQGYYFGDDEYDDAYSSLNRLNKELDSYKKSLVQTDNEQDKTAKSAEKMGKSMKKADNHASGFGKTLGLLKMSLLFSVAFQALSAVTSGIGKGFQNLAQYSSTTNNTLSILATSLQTLQNSLATAFSPILTAITPALQTFISYLSSAITVMGQFFSYLITGSRTFTRAKDAQIDYAASIKKAAQEANKALSPIDKLNQVSDSSGSGSGYTGPSPADMFEDVKIDSKITDAVDGLRKALQPTIDAFKKLNEQLTPLKDFAAQALIDFYNNFLKPVGNWVLGKGIPGLTTALGNLLKNIDWKALNKSLANLFEALGKFTVGIGQGFIDFIVGASEALSPGIGTAISLLGKGLDILADAINSLSPQTVHDLGVSLGVLLTSLALAKTLTGVGAILGSLGTGLGGLAGGLAMFATLNPMAFVVVFDGLFKDLEEWVAGNIAEKFGDIWNKILIVFANVGLGAATGFSIGGIPGAIIGALIGGLIAAVHEFDLKPVWENIKSGLYSAAGAIFNYNETREMFSDMISNFKAVLNGEDILDIGYNIISGLFNGIGGALGILLEPILDLFNGIIRGVLSLFGIHSPSTVFAEIGKFLIQGLYNGIKLIISNPLKLFKDLWTNIQTVFKDTGGWFKEKFASAWTNIKTAFSLDNVKTFFSGIWTGIKSNFSNVSDWFKDTFTDAWTKVKNVFSTGGKIYDGIKDGIGDAFKAVVNKLIDGINAIITVPFNKINSMLNTIRNVSILGAKPFSGLWDQNPLSVPKIPKLATGAVIPPNSEFLALLGDQKKGTNIEAPLDTIKQALAEVLQVNAGNNGSITFVAQVNGKTLFEITKTQAELYTSQTGEPAFT